MNSLTHAFQSSIRMSSSLRSFPICRIQYASDLHLEHYEKMAFPTLLIPSARILVLAGDIGRPDKTLYNSFLNWCHDKWDHIFVVAGNHEFYNTKQFMKWDQYPPETYEQRLDVCRAICAQWSNVHFLEKNEVHLEEYNTTFLGTTLWTDIPKEKAAAALYMVNDYNYIAKKDKDGKAARFSPIDSSALHTESVKWLNARIHELEERRKHVVIISHHLPTNSLIPQRYKNHPSNLCFVTNLEDMIRPPVRAWICGHSHHQTQMSFQRDDPPKLEEATILGINAFGYNFNERISYNPEKILTFNCDPIETPSLLA